MNKWIHIIGVAGVATSAIAIMFKKNGWNVSGSDKAFFPPTSDYLKANSINILVGFKADHLYDDKGRTPDLIMFQGTKGENNPEIVEANKLKLKMMNLTEMVSEYIVKEGNSLVVTGTYGKTTITAALQKIFEKAGKEISYIYAGIPVDGRPNAMQKSEKTELSIVEGDEYVTSINDKQSKFFSYKPKYLIINAVEWEHIDRFKTGEEYLANFKTLVSQISADGLIVANANSKNVVLATKDARCKVIYYSIDRSRAEVTPQWELMKSSKPLPCFVRLSSTDKGFDIIPYERKIIGEFNEENFLAAAVMAYELGIKKERIQDAIREFRGIKRRLEVNYESNNIVVIDDLGSSPPKAKGALQAIFDDYPDAKVYVVYEPNLGSRSIEALAEINKVFDCVDEVFIPRFSRIPNQKEASRFAEIDMKNAISSTKTVFEPDDFKLVQKIVDKVIQEKSGEKVVLFLSSHSLRGMKEQLIKLLEK